MPSRTIALMLTSAVIGMVVAIPITPVFSILRKIFYVPFIRRRLLRQATEQGHVVQAKLAREQDEYVEHKNLGRVPSNYTEGLYCYEYGGRSYRYRYTTAGIMPQELTLYFQKRPRKACLSHELGIRESNWLLHYAGLSVLAAVVILYQLEGL